MTEHSLVLMTIGATKEIEQKLQDVRKGDGIYMKGMTLRVKSMKFKGHNINLPDFPKALYVTELRLGKDTFRAP